MVVREKAGSPPFCGIQRFAWGHRKHAERVGVISDRCSAKESGRLKIGLHLCRWTPSSPGQELFRLPPHHRMSSASMRGSASQAHAALDVIPGTWERPHAASLG